MTTAVPDAIASPRTRALPVLGLVALGGVASLGAGAIHAAAIGVHAEHHQAVITFTVVAVFQLGWGALALTRSNRWVAAVGVIGNAALVGGWAIAKTRGITFIDGLEEVEPVQMADAMAAGLATVAVAASALAIWRPLAARAVGGTVTGGFAVAVLAMTLPGMIAAGNHVHSHGTVLADGTTAHVHNGVVVEPAVVPPHPYDPTQPIDLSGVDGVTPEQQARAENLIVITLARLPQFSDPAVAVAAGYHSIGDGLTGFEHYVNWSIIDDNTVLDPDHPESLVYRVSGGTKTLEAAMFMLPRGSTLDTVPDVGGKLMQWHIHDNLCFTNDPVAPHVAGITNADGSCSAPLVKFVPVPMIHVWIVSQPCGPFAALEGIGGGQIKAGEERLCDHVHGTGF